MTNKEKIFKIQIRAFITIFNGEMIRFLRIWPQTLLPSAITMTLYFVIFGHFIGSRIGTIENVTYMQFITPGLIMMAIITNSYSNVVSSFYSIRFQHSVEELLIAPVANSLIILGYCSGGVVRGLIVGFLVMLISLFFTHLSIVHLGITIIIVVFTAILFSLAGFTNAVFARKFDDISIVPTFILTPLTYLGGIFYSLHQLPETWQLISKFNPVLYMVNGFRYGILNITDVKISYAIFIIGLFIIGLFILNLQLLRKGVGVRT